MSTRTYPLFPYPTPFRSSRAEDHPSRVVPQGGDLRALAAVLVAAQALQLPDRAGQVGGADEFVAVHALPGIEQRELVHPVELAHTHLEDRKSTRLNSSH